MKYYGNLLQEIAGDEKVSLENLSEKNLLKLLKKVGGDLSAIKKERSELLEDEKVKRYVQIDDQNDRYQALHKKLEENYQKSVMESCDHQLWYLIYSENDDHEGRLYWNCSCLECGYRKEGRSRDFSGTIIHGGGIFGRLIRNDYTYEEVRYAYRILLDKYERYFDNRKKAYDEKVIDNLILEDDQLLYSKEPVIKLLKKKMTKK